MTQHGYRLASYFNSLQDAVGYVIRYAFAEIIGNKVHLRQEILACRPPGGDPLKRSAAVTFAIASKNKKKKSRSGGLDPNGSRQG